MIRVSPLNTRVIVELESKFENKIVIIQDYASRMPKGFGFVEFSHADDASYAVRHMDGKKLHGTT